RDRAGAVVIPHATQICASHLRATTKEIDQMRLQVSFRRTILLADEFHGRLDDLLGLLTSLREGPHRRQDGSGGADDRSASTRIGRLLRRLAGDAALRNERGAGRMA